MFYLVRAAATLGLLLASDLMGAESAILADSRNEAHSLSERSGKNESAAKQGGVVFRRDDLHRSSSQAVAWTRRSAIEEGELERLVPAIGACRGVDPKLLRVIIQRESSGNPFAVSAKNTLGLMQLHPSTAKRFGGRDPFDPVQNLEAGTDYLRFLLDHCGNRLSAALAANNAGEATVDRHSGIPPNAETRRFVSQVLETCQDRGGQVAPDDPLQPSAPVHSMGADEGCVPVGLRDRRQAGQERRHE